MLKFAMQINKRYVTLFCICPYGVAIWRDERRTGSISHEQQNNKSSIFKFVFVFSKYDEL